MPGSRPDRFGTAEERFWRKVGKSEECWEWTGAKTAAGSHGRFAIGAARGGMVMAHRFSWELAFGPIPAGLSVLHACDNPPCVRPDHLMLGTTRANMVDAARKARLGTTKNATHCERGHAFEGNTYIHPTTGRRSCHECIRDRNKTRPPRLRTGSHWARPDAAGRCLICGEQLEHGSTGNGRVGWRHSRWAA